MTTKIFQMFQTFQIICRMPFHSDRTLFIIVRELIRSWGGAVRRQDFDRFSWAAFVTVSFLALNPALAQSNDEILAERRAAQLQLGGTYAFGDGTVGRVVHEGEGFLRYRYKEENWLGLGFQIIGKSFRGVPLRYDRILKFDHTWVFARRSYLLTGIDFNVTRHYSAEQSLWADYHEPVFRDLDLGLMFRYKNYPTEDALSLTPTAYFAKFDPLIFQARADVLIKPKVLASADVKVSYQLLSLTKIFGGGGGGKSDEGDGLTDQFWQATFGASQSLSKTIDIRGDFQIYRGKLRDENRFAGGLQCYF